MDVAFTVNKGPYRSSTPTPPSPDFGRMLVSAVLFASTVGVCARSYDHIATKAAHRPQAAETVSVKVCSSHCIRVAAPVSLVYRPLWRYGGGMFIRCPHSSSCGCGEAVVSLSHSPSH